MSIIDSLPAAGQSDVERFTDIALTFSDVIELGSGSIAVVRASDDVVVELAPIDDERVSLSGDTLTFDPEMILGSSTQYYVTLSAGVVAPEWRRGLRRARVI